MSNSIKTRVLVIGGGPGGYVAAIRCGQLGLDTVLVDADRLGGTCLIRGCIPSKALIHASSLYAEMNMAAKQGRFGISMETSPRLNFDDTLVWKDTIVDRLNGGVAALLKRANVRVIHGWASFSDAKRCTVDTVDGPLIIDADQVILATGSVPVELPFLPFDDRVVSSTGALCFSPLPKTLAVVGAGYIGVELGSAFAKLGVAVSMVDAQPQILPLYDAKLVEPVKRWLGRHGVTLHLGAQARELCDDGLLIETADGAEHRIQADKILVAVGRKPLTQGWGLEEMAVAMDGAFVRVDECCATSTTGVWAIGDLVGEPMLAHKASAQGEMVAEIIAGQRRRFTPAAIPAICFTEPEIVSVGLSPDDCDPRDILVGQFPYAANGRALSMDAGDTGGFVRVVAQRDNHRILGIQAVGAHVSELSLAFTQALEMNAVLEDVTGIIHAHPTLGEAYHEASLKALGHAIHI